MSAIRPAIRSAIRPAIRSVFGGSAAVSAIDPTTLFAGGELGVLFDPSTLSTMFQDTAGSSPVTSSGQSIGLLVDKSAGLVLGSELITTAANRDFSSDTGFWSKETSATISGGVVNINNASERAAIYRFNFPNEPGGYYELTFDLALTAGALEVLLAPITVGPINTSGTKTLRIFRAAVDTFAIRNVGATTTTGTLDNISIKRIAGNHAYQSTSAQRPKYQAAGGLHWVENDLSDDSISCTVPNLGTNATVAYADGSGTTILTSQTIGAGTLTLPNVQKLYGYIAVNRALTAAETAGLTVYLDQKRGA